MPRTTPQGLKKAIELASEGLKINKGAPSSMLDIGVRRTANPTSGSSRPGAPLIYGALLRDLRMATELPLGASAQRSRRA